MNQNCNKHHDVNLYFQDFKIIPALLDNCVKGLNRKVQTKIFSR